MTVVENLTSVAIYCDTTTVTAAVPITVDQDCLEVLVQGDPDNTVDLFVGNSTSQVIQIKPGGGAAIPVDNVSKVYARSADGVTAARVNWLARS